MELGVRRTARRLVLGAAMLVAAVLGLVAGVVGLVAASETSGPAPIAASTRLAGNLVAWGPAFLVGLRASVGALAMDAEDGLERLAREQGCRVHVLRVARALGLALNLTMIVLVGALVAWLVVAINVARLGHLVAARAVVGALVYSAAYGIAIGATAMAIGGQRRSRGAYLAIALTIGLPAAGAFFMASDDQGYLADLLSIPGALSAIQGGLMDPTFDGARLGRGLFVVVLVSAVALMKVARVAAPSRDEASLKS